MIKNYLLIALRNLWKNKLYVLINTGGLGIALACCITAYTILAFNIEFDDHIPNDAVEDVFRIHTNFISADGTLQQHLASPIAMGPAMVNDFAGVEAFARINTSQGFVRYEDKSFNEGVRFSEPSLFELIPFEFIKGSVVDFGLNTVILEERTAEKYFPDENPLGKVLTFNFPNQKVINAKVIAVTARVPINSSISYGILMHTDHFMDIYGTSNSDWGDWRDPSLFVRLKNPEDATEYIRLMNPYVAIRNDLKEDAKVQSFHLEQFKEPVREDEVYWSQLNLQFGMIPLVIFGSMALLILLIACFNMTNTTIAITAKRYKEVGIRKVVGASRAQVIIQFMTEMILTILLALIAGLIVSPVIMNEFSDMWNLRYEFSDLNGINLVIALIVLLFMASIIAGIYPALKNSSFPPVTLLKSQIKIKSNNWVSQSLVALQFALSVIVLINGIVFMQNMKFQENVDYGFNLDNVLTVFIQDKAEYEILNTRIKSDPRVQRTAISHHQLGMSSYPFPVKVNGTEYSVQHIEIGEGFFETMGMTLVDGRFIDATKVSDEQGAIVVNEEFLKQTATEDPFNTTIQVRDARLRIVGVVKNHIDNLFRNDEAEPFVFYVSKPNEYQIMLVRGDQADLPAIRDNLELIWKEEFPDKPFEAEFQEELTAGGLRQTNQNLGSIFLFLTILAGLLSASGIFSLAALSIERRTKEIGIRKALGGSLSHILIILNKQFIYLLLIASVLGGTAGFFLSTSLLDTIYALHVPIYIWTIIASVMIVMIVGLLTIGTITLRAAQSNPVKSLRYE